MKDMLKKADPYHTSIGELMNTKKLKESIERYMVESGDINLNYEYENNDVKLVFITGKNDEEQKLPIWEHPLVIETTNNEYIVATDMRSFLKIKNDDFLHMREMVRDNGGYEFNILRTLLVADYLNGNLGVLRNVQKNIVSGFSYWLSTMLSSALMLSPVEKVNTEIAIQHYMFTIMTNSEPDASLVTMIVNKISTNKLSLPANNKAIKEKVLMLNHNVKTIDDLVENIKLLLGDVKGNLLNTNVLINIISNSWYGPGGSETIIMSTENIPTWVSMMYSSSNNKTYKKTKLAMILDSNKSKINLKDFITNVELYMKEKII